MMPVKIYLGDLTYDTVALSTESFPLNIGYIASYCKKQFGDKVEITLFKYIEKLDKAINNSPPDVLGLSNYAWNQRIDMEMFDMLLKQNPYAITIWGGPNFPADIKSQKEFLDKNKVDVYVPIEGEVGFSNIIKRALEADSKKLLKEKVLSNPIEGCISRNSNGEISYLNTGIRTKALDEIPSPYLNGMLDEFFDNRLSPMIQTNRGCPFSCSYCVDGSAQVMKVNSFSLERIDAELEYIANHVPKNTHSMFISDLNFGMIPRDLEVCESISKIQSKYGYPTQIQATTGKNSKDKIIKAVQKLNGALRLWMSVQSMDQQVLTNVRRDNISVDQIIAIAPEIKKSSLRTISEVILGLPGDSYNSHLETLRTLVKAKMDHILVYTCMMLNGAEMNTPQEREKWGLRTKFRVLPRDFVKLSNGKNVIEIEEVVVKNNTLSFDEYINLRIVAVSMYITNHGVVFDALLRFLHEKQVDVFELFFRSSKINENTPKVLVSIIEQIKNDTKNELWDSPEEIEEYYLNEKNYQRLITGEDGKNVLQFYHALVFAEHMSKWTDYILDTAKIILKNEGKFNGDTVLQFADISNYCKGVSHNPFGEDRMQTNPEFNFTYDISNWLKDNNCSSLEQFKMGSTSKFKFIFSEKQFKILEDKLEVFGNNQIGRSQAIKRTPVEMLWRKPEIIV
jgi:radical SAM superfamily enzyme YgiQ (UPF0313 family)